MASDQRSRIVAVVSDIHFDQHDVAAWRAFRLWHAQVRPSATIVLGDFVDFGMLSRYAQGPDAPVHAVEQIKMFVREANALAEECGRLIVVEGNHDERWTKMVFGLAPSALRGARGLDLKSQCLQHGLDKRVDWRVEANGAKPVRVGQFVLRHGHKQAGSWTMSKHIAANRIAKSLGTSEIVGHHHVAQLACATAHDRTVIVLTNPCLCAPQDYAVDANWQQGWTVLELDEARDLANPYIVLVTDGRCAYGGRIYDGNDGPTDERIFPDAPTVTRVAGDDLDEQRRARNRERMRRARAKQKALPAAGAPPRVRDDEALDPRRPAQRRAPQRGAAQAREVRADGDQGRAPGKVANDKRDGGRVARHQPVGRGARW